ncbi:hypothetical protein EX895_005193 [Sporisorium graminicola]|uniref:Uncharacterized protein n=1 Tax=Sporisorium graminicola TaxID=280036 RepID=A0A4U7KNC2_9BASI|nr:hypothetical protein EX895_005193 [Sporisorium graminicola]TKY85653.1 hypothetical protein EX895_005193 [Sporisorium graminicola]
MSAANCDPDMPKMRSSLFPLLLPLLLGADYVLSQTQSMPAIVAALPDARALWTHLEDESFLPARFKTKELKYFYDEPWQAFLQAQGSKFIDKQLKELVNQPNLVFTAWAIDPEAKRIAAGLIEKYAEHRQNSATADSVRAAVSEAWQMHGEDMLIDNKAVEDELNHRLFRD